MYTVLRGEPSGAVWADSPSTPFRRAHTPAMIEDPVRIRQLLLAARTPEVYCGSIRRAGLPDDECAARWAALWSDVWRAARGRYDYVLLWGGPEEVIVSMPRDFVPVETRGRL